MHNGHVKNNTFTIKNVKDVNKFFDNAIEDAQFFAESRNGKPYINRTEKSLYIGYLDVECTVIDRVYQIL